MDSSTLTAFRQGLYGCFTACADALMNLNDALLSEIWAGSLAQLSLSPFFLRRWPSLYAGLQDGQIEQAALRSLLSAWAPLTGERGRFLLGLDTSDIARPFSETAKDRIGLPIANLPKNKGATTCGWRFSSLVVLPEPTSSFVYPLDTQRVTSEQTPAQTGAEQLRAVVALLPGEKTLTADRHYGSAAFLQQVADVPCEKLLRVQGHRVFYRPAPQPTGQRGRPRLDGERFKCSDPTTHNPPDQQWSGTDEQGRFVEVACWHNLHFRQCRDVTLSLLRVTRPAATGKKRDPKVSWFVWQSSSQTRPRLSEVASTYRLRYGHEHGFRFLKQALLWEQPRLRTPEQFARWTQLMMASMAQLTLARPLVEARRLPWESQSRPATPQQVRRAMGSLLLTLGTPAKPPQPRGKSPGRSQGATIQKAPRFQVVKKTKINKQLIV